MHPPTVIFSATIGLDLITVIDVSGTYHVHVYRLTGNRTIYEFGETFSNGDDAIAKAEHICRMKN